MSSKMFRIRPNDHAISPVIGTILMVAATVIIAGAVYAAVSAYSGKSNKAPPDSSWKAQATDTNGNGLDDTIKVTYLSGPDAATSSIGITVTNTATHANATGYAPASWTAGAYETYSPGAGTYDVTIVQAGQTVLQQTFQLKE